MAADRHLLFAFVTLTTLAALSACGGDDDGDDDGVADASTDARADATPQPDASTPDAARADADAAFDAGENFTTSVLLINEISGGDEWIELVNSSAATFDASGFVLADRDKETGEPKLSEAVTFPSGTALEPGAYLLVRGGGLGDAAKACPGPDAGVCFHAEFGISNKNGESLFLLDPGATVVGKVVYPPNASQGSFSYSRVPNADPNAAFATVKETPGAANVP